MCAEVTAGNSQRRKHDSDERNLPHFDAEIKKQQRERYRTLGQTNLCQGAGKTKPVQQAECKRDDPRSARHAARPSAGHLHDFAGHEYDR